MPDFPQAAAPAQPIALSKEREDSTIPKTGGKEGEVWAYPSPQQFYHAMRRKDKDPEAELMDSVVHVHNVVNERSWQQVMEWERMHAHRCPVPSLQRFVGRSEDLAPRAMWSSYFSYRGRPFDRHDWYVDRCGEKTVRYVIDYYDDPRTGDEYEVSIDTRPALDDLGNLFDRLRRPFWNLFFRNSAAQESVATLEA